MIQLASLLRTRSSCIGHGVRTSENTNAFNAIQQRKANSLDQNSNSCSCDSISVSNGVCSNRVCSPDDLLAIGRVTPWVALQYEVSTIVGSF